jgi:hypothetical protein
LLFPCRRDVTLRPSESPGVDSRPSHVEPLAEVLMRTLHARSPGAHSATVCPAYRRRPPRRPQQRPCRRCTGRSCAGWPTEAAAMTATGHRAQLRRADRRSGRRWRSARAGRTAEHGTQRSLPVRPALHRRLGPHHCRRRGHQPGDRDSAFRVGEEAGLPLHRYSLEDAAAAHAAVEGGATGKVLITVATS